ncbi:hypothetical protein KBB96_10045 [Luteolibacter ambystomatis]|uniref:Uncharacterized protein n=1 Tax=Luteolibacter ambystomatis TaxID=2824561 RepID=A0A975J3B6_9BACT|nr:hypothetical protein [Luteolibacter ambystomatis]QUE53221.1 hypothetical protein KBB96_10045 [Luteolibacter ambystomatis]
MSDELSSSLATGPAPHEDFTIRQLVELNRIVEEGGEVVAFQNDGSVVRIRRNALDTFLDRYGHLHPGDFKENEGCDWQEALSSLAEE